MEFIQDEEPEVRKPIIIAAMQDMGNVGSIVVNFINDSLQTKTFRTVKPPFPTYVIDQGGYIELPNESWEYKHTDDLIIFGGGKGQPKSNSELNILCQDVIDISKKYSAKFIYTLGGFHTNRNFHNNPKTFITSTSEELMNQMKGLNVETTPQRSVITGFNGLQEATEGDLTFLANSKYVPLTKTTKASAILTSRDIEISGISLIRTDNPSLAFSELMNVLGVEKQEGETNPDFERRIKEEVSKVLDVDL